jgi:hypothetical protein
VFGPATAERLLIGGTNVPVTRTPSGSLLGRARGPAPVHLPALTTWRTHREAPEAAPTFDDANWTVADKTTTSSPMQPRTLPVLYADDYGFHYGNVWYRGHFTATGAETEVSLNAITGRRGIYLVWLNGRYLGSADGGVQADAGPPANPDAGRGDFAIPEGLLQPGAPATLSVLVENMGHNDDWTAEDERFKQPRGLVGASITGLDTPITWRIQGARGGRDLVDPARGPLNTGGLYGERSGWHLPGYPDDAWAAQRGLSDAAVAPGVAWYRTTFSLQLPKDHDVPVALRFAGSSGPWRALVFLNGWNVGQYFNGRSPQRDFALPAGLLRQRGENTLAIAVIAQDDVVVGSVQLVTMGNQRGGVAVRSVNAPSYDARTVDR